MSRGGRGGRGGAVIFGSPNIWEMPRRLIGELLRSGSLIRGIPYMATAIPSATGALGGDQRLIVIQLPDGRERAIPRSATAVASASDDPATAAGRLAHISVRTLLPLANHVRAVLASRHADLEAGGGRHLEQATAAHGGVAGSAATPVAAAADRDTTSPGTTDRPACATSAPAVRARRGGSSC